ncbi:hypothetical protein AABM36_08345 [Kocuria sp. KSNUG]|uniref:hypothetical protein n=1 Tax=Kocuria sp. KSNUG TaxID=3136676 RepID=UPI003C307DBF
MAAGDIHVINGIRYQEHDAITRGLLGKDGRPSREDPATAGKAARPARNKARKAPARVTSESEGGQTSEHAEHGAAAG